MKHESDNVPVVCSLSDAQFRVHEEALLAQFRSAVTAIEELPDGYAFSLPGDKSSIAVTAQLIAAERECCPFMAFELVAPPNMGPVLLRVTGPCGTKDFLKTVFCP